MDNEEKNVNDEEVIDKQLDNKKKESKHSEKFKSKSRKRTRQDDLQIGDLVFLREGRDKTKLRETYCIEQIEDDGTVLIRKYQASLRPKLYRALPDELIRIPQTKPNAGTENQQSEQHSAQQPVAEQPDKMNSNLSTNRELDSDGSPPARTSRRKAFVKASAKLGYKVKKIDISEKKKKRGNIYAWLTDDQDSDDEFYCPPARRPRRDSQDPSSDDGQTSDEGDDDNGNNTINDINDNDAVEEDDQDFEDASSRPPSPQHPATSTPPRILRRPNLTGTTAADSVQSSRTTSAAGSEALESTATSPRTRPSTPASQLYDLQQGVQVLPGDAGEPSQVTYNLSDSPSANSVYSHGDPDLPISPKPSTSAPGDSSMMDLAGMPTVDNKLRNLRTEFSVPPSRPVPVFNPQLDVLNKDQMNTRFPLLRLGEGDRSSARASRAEAPPVLPALQRRFSAPSSPSSVDLQSVSNLGDVLQQALEHLDPSDTIQLGQRAPVVNLDQLNARQRRNIARPANYRDFHNKGTR